MDLRGTLSSRRQLGHDGSYLIGVTFGVRVVGIDDGRYLFVVENERDPLDVVVLHVETEVGRDGAVGICEQFEVESLLCGELGVFLDGIGRNAVHGGTAGFERRELLLELTGLDRAAGRSVTRIEIHDRRLGEIGCDRFVTLVLCGDRRCWIAFGQHTQTADRQRIAVRNEAETAGQHHRESSRIWEVRHAFSVAPGTACMNDSVLDTIGSPLVQVYSPPGSTIAAKLESKNPAGSAKDRPALWMVEQAEREGVLSPDDRIVEPTSGNTGIGLALVAATKGYDLTIVMPSSKSPERRQIMRAYGADIDLVDGEISDAKDRADSLAQEGMVQLHQFENPANTEAHYRTTGPEILQQVGDRSIDALVAGVGTGGTISGVGRRLREAFPEMEIVAVEPEANAVLSTGESGEDAFQGMGPGFVSDNLELDLLDSVETVSIDAAEAECRRLAREEGLLVGQSSGASNVAARRVAARLATPELNCPPTPGTVAVNTDTAQADGGPNETHGEYDDCPLVVTVFPDSGERYMSTGMFDADMDA